MLLRWRRKVRGDAQTRNRRSQACLAEMRQSRRPAPAKGMRQWPQVSTRMRECAVWGHTLNTWVVYLAGLDGARRHYRPWHADYFRLRKLGESMYRDWREFTNALLGVRGEGGNLPKQNCFIISLWPKQPQNNRFNNPIMITFFYFPALSDGSWNHRHP